MAIEVTNGESVFVTIAFNNKNKDSPLKVKAAFMSQLFGMFNRRLEYEPAKNYFVTAFNASTIPFP